MTVFTLVFPVIVTALQGVLLAAMTTIMPPELPLGVRVPTAHAADPAIRSAVRRFRLSQIVVWVITALLAIALTGSLPVLAVILPVLLFIPLALVSFVIARRSIIRAKREGDWFTGLPVRVSAEVTAPVHHRPPIIWPILAVVVIAIAVAIGVAEYPHLPDPIPTHFDMAGHVTATAPKSIWSVFGVLMVAAAVVLLLSGLSVAASRFMVRPVGGDTPTQATTRSRVQRGVLAALLSELSFVVALGFSAIVVAPWLAPGSFATGWAAIVLIVLIVAVVIAAVVRTQRGLSGANRRDEPRRSPDAPDDDRHWKGGMIYVNRDDPALWVPKRFGLGWTINLGRPAGMAIGILLTLGVVGGVLAAVLSVRAH
jgi:uncharacterized membrane protein